MKLIGIKRKGSDEVIMVVPQGKSYRLPGGLTPADVELTMVYVPEVGDGVVHLSPEQMKQLKQKREEDNRHLQKMADEQGIGVGDLIAAITTSTGFKKWWDEKHGGKCSDCNKRQATLNYYKFKGSSWVSNWVRKILKKG